MKAHALPPIHRLLTFLFFFLNLGLHAFATDWFVDNTATGANNGTSWANAWTSPLNITASVQPGDTVFISGGPTGTSQTYNMTAFWNPRDGTAGNRINYRIGQDAAHNGTAIFNYTGATPNSNPWFTGVNDANVSGDAGDGQKHFKITGYTLGVSNVKDVKLEYIDASAPGLRQFADFRFGGAATSGIEVGFSHIVVTDPNSSNAIFADVTGVTAYDAGLLIHHSTIEIPYRPNLDGFGADGIDSNGNGITIRDSTIKGFSSTYTGGQHQDGWQGLGNSQFLKFYNNVFLNITNYAIFGEAFSGSYQDVQIYNNIVTLGDSSFTASVGSSGIVFGVNNGARTFTNVLIANNTIVDYGTRPGIALNNVTATPATFTGCVIKNNVLVNSGAIDLQGNTTTDVSNNTTITSSAAPGLLTSYTLFGGTNNNLRPLLSSTLVDNGVDLSAFFTTDIIGTARPQGIAWDIGAYEVIQTNPTIITQPPAAVTVATGGNTSITVLARGEAPLSFQWKKNGINLSNGGVFSGATSATLVLTGVSIADAGSYTVEINNALGPLVTSSAATLTVGATAPSFISQPIGTQTVTWGDNVTISATATGLPTPTYRWRLNGVDLADGGGVSGSDTASLLLTSVTGSSAGTYTVVASNGVSPAATSNNSILVVNGIPTAITTHPVSQTVLVGSGVTFIVGATGSPAPTYQWNFNGAPIPGATSATYTIPAVGLSQAGSYTATATNSVNSVTSAAATLTIGVPPPPPVINFQPSNATVVTGRDVSLRAGTTGNTSIGWQVSTDGGTNWSALNNDAVYSGVNTNTLTINDAPETFKGRMYRAIAFNAGGSVITNAVTLNVIPSVFTSPADLAVSSSGNIFVSDNATSVIYRVAPDLSATVYAGTENFPGSTDGSTLALLRQPGGVVLDSAGNLYVADTGNSLIRRVTPGGTLSRIAGSELNQAHRDGTGSDAWFNMPRGIAIDSAGNLYVADTGNSVIRKITSAGVVTTLAGSPGARGSVDGSGTAARFNSPSGVAVDSSGNVFVTDTLNQTIRRITAAGAVTTLAGVAGISGANDGTGTGALFNQPSGITIDGSGNLWVSDSGNSIVRRVTAGGVVTTIAGLPTVSGLEDGTGLNSLFNFPIGLRFDTAGNLFVVDNGNVAIRRISATAAVTTLPITRGTSTPSVPDPTPLPPTIPTPVPPSVPSAHGGGGGAPSVLLYGLLGAVYLCRRLLRSNQRG